ncbi:hypothetical protein R1sor_023371 [Riccia sorocarpa]|uniref:Uncharacterized protein n=1 Tax=Riccia sorocarpa TaxID=122646 RepID=A0ABD3GMF6_9MARC
MDKTSFTRLLHIIEDHLIFKNGANYKQTPVLIQLAVALDRLGHEGNGSALRQRLFFWGTGEGTMVKFTYRVLVPLESKLSGEVCWPDQQDRLRIALNLKQMDFLDGTLIYTYVWPSLPALITMIKLILTRFVLEMVLMGLFNRVYVLAQNENRLLTMRTRRARSRKRTEYAGKQEGKTGKMEISGSWRRCRLRKQVRMLVEDIREGVLVFEDDEVMESSLDRGRNKIYKRVFGDIYGEAN